MKSAIIGFVTLFVLVFFFGLAPSIAVAQLEGKKPEVKQPEGKWSGNVKQWGAKMPDYAVEMDLDLSGGGSIGYPGLECGGTLTFIRKEERSFFYRERITYGKEKCIDGGTLRLTPRDDKLDWYWFGGPVSARALLTREITSVYSVSEPQNCLDCTVTFERDNKECAMKFSDLKVRAKCRDDVLTALRKCFAGCKR